MQKRCFKCIFETSTPRLERAPQGWATQADLYSEKLKAWRLQRRGAMHCHEYVPLGFRTTILIIERTLVTVRLAEVPM